MECWGPVQRWACWGLDMCIFFSSARGTSEDHVARRWARPAHNPRGCAGLNPGGSLAWRPLQHVPISPGAGPMGRSLCSASDLSTTPKYPLGHRLLPPSSSGNTFSRFSLNFSFPASQDAGVGVSVPFACAAFPNPASTVPVSDLPLDTSLLVPVTAHPGCLHTPPTHLHAFHLPLPVSSPGMAAAPSSFRIRVMSTLPTLPHHTPTFKSPPASRFELSHLRRVSASVLVPLP